MTRQAPTDEARRAAKAARAATIAATRPTTAPGSETTALRVGDRVRVNRQGARSGTWGRYDGREAWVTKVNRQQFPDGTRYVEIGVAWHRGADAGTQAWFRTDEVVPL